MCEGASHSAGLNFCRDLVCHEFPVVVNVGVVDLLGNVFFVECPEGLD